MQLTDRDRVVSGRDARVLLRMPEGSLVKLGADGRLDVDRLLVRKDPEGSVVTAALNVLGGAFRFTTQVAAQFRGRREVDVRIATITAGIRGTDLWGKAADDRDIVCLIEGNISVSREGEQPFAMNQPLSFYIAPRNAPALPVAPVPKEQLERWAAETEIQSGSGAAREGGQWMLYLTDVVGEEQALRLQARLRDAGYPAQVNSVTVRDLTFYRVRIENLPSYDEARSLGERLASFPEVRSPRPVRG
jgi:hypothetical protein